MTENYIAEAEKPDRLALAAESKTGHRKLGMPFNGGIVPERDDLNRADLSDLKAILNPASQPARPGRMSLFRR